MQCLWRLAVLLGGAVACSDASDRDISRPERTDIQTEPTQASDAGTEIARDATVPVPTSPLDDATVQQPTPPPEAPEGALDAGAGRDAASPGEDEGERDANVARDDAGPPGGPVEPFPVIYSDILAVSCVTADCHGAGHISGLDLSSAAIAYTQLIERSVGEASAPGGSPCAADFAGKKRVAARNASGSLLIQKLTVPDEDVCGERMPPSAEELPQAVVDRIKRWIAAGASFE